MFNIAKLTVVIAASATVGASVANAQRAKSAEQQNRGLYAYQFVGFTSATTNGDAGGFGGLNDMCAAEMPGAKLCTAGQIAATYSGDDAPTTGVAWVRGQFAATLRSVDSIPPFFIFDQQSGFAYQGGANDVFDSNCRQFRNADPRTGTIPVLGAAFGRRFGESPALVVEQCTRQLSVACCAVKFAPAAERRAKRRRAAHRDY